MKQIIPLNLTKVKKGIILHGVNCQGVMGGGIAYALVKTYPAIFTRYSQLCKDAKSPYDLLGEIDPVTITQDLTIVNCFTQNFFGTAEPPASYGAVYECLFRVVDWAQGHYDTELDMPVYMPQIGCGLGGLDWTIVSQLIEFAEHKFKFKFNVCDLPENLGIRSH